MSDLALALAAHPALLDGAATTDPSDWNGGAESAAPRDLRVSEIEPVTPPPLRARNRGMSAVTGRLGHQGGTLMTVEITEIEHRKRAVEDARRSSELEGSRSTEATRSDQDAYVRGEIDIEQLGRRVRSRYGLS